MSAVDSLSDLITRIRNAQMMGNKVVFSPVSKERCGVLKVLLENGYIRSFSIIDDFGSKFKKLKIELKYCSGIPVIVDIKRVSKPSRRVYSGWQELSLVKNGLGISILSTNKGIVSDVEARKLSVGGEVLCTVF